MYYLICANINNCNDERLYSYERNIIKNDNIPSQEITNQGPKSGPLSLELFNKTPPGSSKLEGTTKEPAPVSDSNLLQ